MATEAGMFAIREERDYIVQDDLVKAARKTMEVRAIFLAASRTRRPLLSGSPARSCRTRSSRRRWSTRTSDVHRNHYRAWRREVQLQPPAKTCVNDDAVDLSAALLDSVIVCDNLCVVCRAQAPETSLRERRALFLTSPGVPSSRSGKSQDLGISIRKASPGNLV